MSFVTQKEIFNFLENFILLFFFHEQQAFAV